VAFVAIGTLAPTALDLAYANYQQWCARLGYPAASFEDWQRASSNVSPHSRRNFETPASFSDMKRQQAYHREALTALGVSKLPML
jgi:hypothetical protein